MKKTLAATMAILLGVSATVFAFNTNPQASQPTTELTRLAPDTVYEYDLDQDGSMDQLSFTLTEAGVYEITVNNQTASIPLDPCFYDPELTIMDIDTEDGKLDLWAACNAFSNDICYSGLFRYENGKPVSIWETERGADVLSTDGAGTLYLVYDRLFPADNLVGNHWDQVSYTVKNDQVSPVITDTHRIVQTLNPQTLTHEAVASMTCASDLTFKLDPEDDACFTLKEGSKVTPKEIKMAGEDTCYVSFETEDGQIGWLYSEDYGWSNQPFTDMCFCD